MADDDPQWTSETIDGRRVVSRTNFAPASIMFWFSSRPRNSVPFTASAPRKIPGPSSRETEASAQFRRALVKHLSGARGDPARADLSARQPAAHGVPIFVFFFFFSRGC
jgi:hypothetical protein